MKIATIKVKAQAHGGNPRRLTGRDVTIVAVDEAGNESLLPVRDFVLSSDGRSGVITAKLSLDVAEVDLDGVVVVPE